MFASDFHCHSITSLFIDKLTKIQIYAKEKWNWEMP